MPGPFSICQPKKLETALKAANAADVPFILLNWTIACAERFSEEIGDLNADASHYVCVETTDKPWMRRYDINRNGVIGVDDLAAFIQHSNDAEPNDKDWRAVNCLKTRIGFLEEEVQWKLPALFIQHPNSIDSQTALSQIDAVEQSALERLDLLAGVFESQTRIRPKIVDHVLSSITEIALRARRRNP